MRTVPSLLTDDLQPISCAQEGGKCLFPASELTENPMFLADISVKGKVGVTPQDRRGMVCGCQPKVLITEKAKEHSTE